MGCKKNSNEAENLFHLSTAKVCAEKEKKKKLLHLKSDQLTRRLILLDFVFLITYFNAAPTICSYITFSDLT